MSQLADIKQIMEKAKKEIEERKSILASQNEARLASMAALQARIASTMGSLERKGVIDVSQQQFMQQQQQLQYETIEERDKSLNIVIDAMGRAVDKRTGEVVQIQSRMPTLKANLRVAARRDGLKPKLEEALKEEAKPENPFLAKHDEDAEVAASSSFFDARLKMKTSLRNKRKLSFVEKGKYVDMAKKLRDKAKIDLLKQEISKISKKTGISAESRLASIQPKRYTKETTVPNIEWWDFAVLNDFNYDCLESMNENDVKAKLQLTNLIEHPVQMKPPTQSDKKVIPTVMLTTKERKKLRRQARTETLKEDQEKIRLGLIPPPEPKVKISNLMRVLGTEAVQDPTKVEEYVRNQMAKRQKQHEQANEERKLTPEQRAAKKEKKLMENTSLGVNVSVYRVKELNDPSVKFKVEANCNQLYMTGVVVLYKSINVVIVEGGPKQQKKFKRLMLNRIKWSEIVNKKSRNNDDDDDGPKEKNSCALVWEGMTKQRCFAKMIYKSCPSVTFAREFFKKHNCEHYWDAAQSDAIIEMCDQ